MSSVNRVLICGTLGHDVDLKTTRNGRPFCRMSLATNGPAKDAEGKRRTYWHSVHVFGPQAESMIAQARKGSQIWVEGRLETFSQEVENGPKVWKTCVTAERINVLSRSSSDATPSDASIAEEARFLKATDAEAMEDVILH